MEAAISSYTHPTMYHNCCQKGVPVEISIFSRVLGNDCPHAPEVPIRLVNNSCPMLMKSWSCLSKLIFLLVWQIFGAHYPFKAETGALMKHAIIIIDIIYLSKYYLGTYLWFACLQTILREEDDLSLCKTTHSKCGTWINCLVVLIKKISENGIKSVITRVKSV